MQGFGHFQKEINPADRWQYTALSNTAASRTYHKGYLWFFKTLRLVWHAMCTLGCRFITSETLSQLARQCITASRLSDGVKDMTHEAKAKDLTCHAALKPQT